ncbi:type IV secretion system protein VirB6 [Aliivibrio fischeri]|uniref:type IV secretion system protein n=1 Tax=Aliivibrio fischeri TaxID=668 RepID=UPI0012DA629A|nr:type IV secretion system protein [Aliivibrio fischeri]MUK41527.1 type IV secretion system protein VirB6 [Aliivibrio fischeri]
MNITVFNWIGTTIDDLTNNFIASGIGGLIEILQPFIIAGVTLYIMIRSYGQIFGKGEDLAIDLVIHGLTVIAITTLVLNIHNYTYYVVEGLNAFASGVSGAINKTDGNIYNTLDELLESGIAQASYCFDKVGLLNDWGWFLAGVIIVGAIVAITALSAILIIGTKFLLTMLFVIGPLFIVFAIYPVTRRYFEGWVAKLMENALVQIFGIMIIGLSLSMISHFIYYKDVSGTGVNPLGVSIQVLIVSGILSWVIAQIPNLAGSLSGGFASSSLSLAAAAAPMIAAAAMAAKFLSGKNIPTGGMPSETWGEQQANQVRQGDAESTPQSTKMAQSVHDKIAEHNRNS